MTLQKVIGFVGMPASGKSTALEVAREWGPVVTMGDVVRAAVRDEGDEITPKNLRAMALHLRELHGPQAIAMECVRQIEELGAEIVFIDGLRSPTEVAEFRASWKFPIIAIVARDEDRYQWLAARGRDDDEQEQEKIRQRDEQELALGIGDVIANADYTIYNYGTIEELQQACESTIREVIENY
ncbi:MAG TPA: AAA family ATPase [Candidatus Lokiarchaeia archaeon]|nr:AAA family ATPase [Candidatus Lokiarchaeia archaeon]